MMSKQIATDAKVTTLRSVFFKATLIVAVSVALVTTVMTWQNYMSSRKQAIDGEIERAVATNPTLARLVSGALRFGKQDQAKAELDTMVEAQEGDSTGMIVIDTEGALFASSLAGANVVVLQKTAVEALQSGGPARSADGFTFAVPAFGVGDGVIYGAIASSWTAEHVLAAQADDLILALAVTAAIFVSAMLGTAFTFYRMIGRPLTRVNAAMTLVAAGDYEVAVPERARRDEIGAIANSLEAFRASLAATVEANKAALMRGAALEAGSTAMMLTDTSTTVIYVNEAMTALLQAHQAAIRRNIPGFDAERILGTQADQIIGTGDMSAFTAQDGSTTRRHERQFSSGSVAIIINPVIDPSGTNLGYVAEWRDITAERRTAAVVSAIDLSQLRAEFSTDGVLLSANARALAIMGDQSEGLIGRNLSIALSVREGAQGAALFEQLAKGQPITGHIIFARGGGSPAILSGAISPVLDAQGKPQQYVLLGADVTEAEAAQAQTEAHRLAYEAAQQTVVDALRGALAHLSEGDLTSTIVADFGADYAQLRTDYNNAMQNLQQAMRGVVENAATIRSEAGEISTAADDLSRRTEQQAATLEQTAAALNQLTASVKSAADVAAQANQMVATAKSNAEVSGNVVRETILAMGEIEESSGKISKITSVIDEIAFQTNLLALNAGVEAARAGEAGRGFAVVASEVRALAQRSSDAAREIAGLISSSTNQVKRGVGLVGQAGEALGGIETSVADIYNFVSEIAVSAREQSSGLAEINIAVNQLDQVTQQNAAMFEETTAASHSLTHEAETLAATMAQFRIDAGTVAAPRAFQSGRGEAAQHGSAQQRPGLTTHDRAQRTVPSPKTPQAGPKPVRGQAALAVQPSAKEADWEDF